MTCPFGRHRENGYKQEQYGELDNEIIAVNCFLYFQCLDYFLYGSGVPWLIYK